MAPSAPAGTNEISPRPLGRGWARRESLAVTLVVVWVSAVFGQTPPEPPVLALGDAVAQALAANRTVASAALDVSRAEEKVASAKSRRWPTLTLSFLASRLLTRIDFEFEKGAFGDFPATGPIPAEDTKVGTPQGFSLLGIGQLQFPLLQQYEIGLNVRLNSAAAEAAREQLREQKQATVNQVRAAYYAIVSAESALAAAEESLGLAREIERVVGERRRAEKALDVDQTESRARVVRADATVYSARDSVASQKEQLNLLLGRPITADFRIAPVPAADAYPGDLAAARARALELHPAVRRARLQVSQAEFAWRLSKADYLPDVAFQANYISPYSVDFLPRNIYSIGILLQWEVFDGGRRRHDALEKAHAVAQAKLADTERENSIAVEIGSRFRRLEQARRELAASELERTSRRERLRITKDRYRAEIVTTDELLRAQADLADADRQYVQALSGFWTARADLERAVGEETW